MCLEKREDRKVKREENQNETPMLLHWRFVLAEKEGIMIKVY